MTITRRYRTLRKRSLNFLLALWWFYAAGVGAEESRRVLFANLKSVVGNDIEVGVNRVAMAWSIRNLADLDALRAALPFPLRVVRLTAPIEAISERLAPAVAAEPQEGIRTAERWLKEGTGSKLGEVEFANDRTIREVSADILDWLEWL